MVKIASLGGGHGLYQTLLAVRRIPQSEVTAIVTVADDGGSSGRLRRELGIIPPGDLRMALSALAGDDEDSQEWASLLQHRFGGHGAMAGHAVGNLLIAGLADQLGSEQEALDRVAELTNSAGRVLPMAMEPLEIEADVAGLGADPRVMHVVRGQVAVATTPGSVRRVRLIPEYPQANDLAVEAIKNADLVTLGPGSWFSSVIPHLLVPEIVEAINSTDALRVVVLNLTAEAGETTGFSAERHIHVLRQHAATLQLDRVLIDQSMLLSPTERRYLEEAAKSLGATAVFCDVAADERSAVHDPAKLEQALRTLL